jgi:hypothetical protein
MKKDKKRVGWHHDRSPKPEFYLTDKEKKDGESSIIHRWLELDNDDSDPTPSAA